MKLMICGDVFGDFELLKKDADFIEAEAILICGNVGIKTDTTFLDYWEGKLSISQPIYFVTGKHEDFGLVLEVCAYRNHKEGESVIYPSMNPVASAEIQVYEDNEQGDFAFTVAGCFGTYSEKYYKKEGAPARHMTEKSLLQIPEKMDVLLLHNVPGKLGKQSGLNFDLRFFDFIKQKQARYIFVGGYGFPHYSCFPFSKSTVLFLCPLKLGYAILDTKDWSCYFNNKM